MWNKEEFLQQWHKSLYLFISKVIKQTYHLYQLHTKILQNTLLARLIPYVHKITRTVSVDFDVTDHVLTINLNSEHHEAD